MLIIKKYANRRLYNTETSEYITLEDLYHLLKTGIDFQVLDAKTGDDLTKLTLTHIIFERESKGSNILPEQFLKQLITFYDGNLSSVLPKYLEQSMQAFVNNQESLQNYYTNYIEQLTRNNLSLMDNMFKMFFQAESNNNKDKE
jgi:polyhydroxyalkanoate synthesis repressor PhaR